MKLFAIKKGKEKSEMDKDTKSNNKRTNSVVEPATPHMPEILGERETEDKALFTAARGHKVNDMQKQKHLIFL